MGPSIPLRRMRSNPSSFGRAVQKHKAPARCTVNERADDTESGEFESGRSTPEDGSGEIVKAVMAWWQVAFLMVAQMIGTRVFTLPSVLAAIGFVPGIILIVSLGAFSTWTAYLAGEFKHAFPTVRHMADAGAIIMGPIGREAFGAAQFVLLTFLVASQILSFGATMDTINGHSACTIKYIVIGAGLSVACAMPRKLETISWMAIVSFLGILVAATYTMVHVGIERPGSGVVHALVQMDLHSSFWAVSNVISMFSGHVAFFGFMSEMKKPQDFKRSSYFSQGCGIIVYLLVAIVIYSLAGKHDLDSTIDWISPPSRKIAYKCALPTIIIGAAINIHIAAKLINLRLCRKPKPGDGESLWTSYFFWIFICAFIWLVALVIAELAPRFITVLSLVIAPLSNWFTYGVSGIFGLFLLRWRWTRDWPTMGLTVANFGIIVVGLIMCGVGLYAAAIPNIAHTKEPGGIKLFTCPSNSTLPAGVHNLSRIHA